MYMGVSFKISTRLSLEIFFIRKNMSSKIYSVLSGISYDGHTFVLGGDGPEISR